MIQCDLEHDIVGSKLAQQPAHTVFGCSACNFVSYEIPIPHEDQEHLVKCQSAMTTIQ
jgi:hypothetical protein